MNVYLVCEGEPGGLDERLLDRLVVQRLGKHDMTHPAGGDRGLGAVRAYLESRAKGNVAIAVEDRNYRPYLDADATWGKVARRSFVWRRHEIENYLLHPAAVVEFFRRTRAAGLHWAAGLPVAPADIEAMLQGIAAGLLEDHVGELVWHEIERDLNGVGHLKLSRQTPAPPPGAAIAGRTEWLAALHAEAGRLAGVWSASAAIPSLQPGAITTAYCLTLSGLHADGFVPTGRFLLDMGGHELMAALIRHLRGLGAPAEVDQDFVTSELIEALDAVYSPGATFTPDCFADLAAVLSRY